MSESNKKLGRRLGVSKKVQKALQKTNDNPPKRGPKPKKK